MFNSLSYFYISKWLVRKRVYAFTICVTFNAKSLAKLAPWQTRCYLAKLHDIPILCWKISVFALRHVDNRFPKISLPNQIQCCALGRWSVRAKWILYEHCAGNVLYMLSEWQYHVVQVVVPCCPSGATMAGLLTHSLVLNHPHCSLRSTPSSSLSLSSSSATSVDTELENTNSSTYESPILQLHSGH